MNKISEELCQVAKKLQIKKSNQSNKIFRIAQEVENLQNIYNNENANFDPSQESQDSSQMAPDVIEPMANDQSEELGQDTPQMTVTPPDGGSSSTTPIESFVKGNPNVSNPNYETHVCKVVFDAPPDAKQSDFMNYVLGISDNLDVKVHKFEWEELESKEAKR